jgi:DNA-binding NarL/FixJ family response regulator
MDGSAVILDGRKTLVVADPRSFMRGILARWLEHIGESIDVAVLVTADAAVAVAEVGADQTAVVLLSVKADAEGREWLRLQSDALRALQSGIRIAVLMDETNLADGQAVALSMGLRAYISLDDSVEIAAAVLSLVMAGGCYYGSVMPLQPRSSVRKQETQRISGKPAEPRLTPREQTVLDLLATGLSNKLIARRLDMGLGTVKIHVHNILGKMNARNRTEVAVESSSMPHARLADLPLTGDQNMEIGNLVASAPLGSAQYVED